MSCVLVNARLESFVFLDDNPAEIEIVRQFLPSVSTIQASEDPVETLQVLLDSPLLFRNSLTQEDADRTEQYRSEVGRKQLETSVSNYDDYLRSLEMSADVNAISDLTVPRAAQLINKSNQFNLTTIRRTEVELKSLSEDQGWNIFLIRLSDRFGDHGIISIVLTKVRGPVLEVDTFVMSCRVLKRGVEQLVVNTLIDIAKMHGCTEVLGCYRPTKKNSIVASLYEDLGFSHSETSAKEDRFVLQVADYQPFDHHIAVNPAELGD